MKTPSVVNAKVHEIPAKESYRQGVEPTKEMYEVCSKTGEGESSKSFDRRHGSTEFDTCPAKFQLFLYSVFSHQ